MAPLPPLTPSAPEPPGTRVRALTRSAVADDSSARQDAAETILAKLRSMIASGSQDAEAILGTIAVAAHALTEANGAAIAMPRDGSVVCVGRSGEIAPELGVLLSVNSGISGECLRTGVILRCDDAARDIRVNPDVCRQLGLQSIAVVPLRGRYGRVGVLEVFSSQSYAFNDEHTALLGRLAGLAEAAWAQGAVAEHSVQEDLVTEDLAAEDLATRDSIVEAPAAENLATENASPALYAASEAAVSETIEQPPHLADAPGALERVGEAIATGLQREWQAERRWHIAMATGLSVLVLLLLAVLGWRAWYKASIQPSSSRAGASSQEDVNRAGSAAAGADLAWKPSAVRPVAHFRAAAASHVAKTPAVKIPDQVTRRQAQSQPVADQSAETRPADSTPSPTDLSQIAANSPAPADLGKVLSTSPALPKLGAPISQGVTGGTLLRRVQPVYPPEARRLRLQGSVILEANIAEDGQIQDLKLVSGHPVLAQAAMDAVRQWRYSPYLLNGQPIRKQTRININFMAP
jgi:TonB family protein